MESLLLSFLFLLTLTSARESILQNVAPKLQPSLKQNNVADKSTNAYSSYPPGFENPPPSHSAVSYPPTKSPSPSPSSESGSESLEIHSVFSEPSSTSTNSVPSGDQPESSSSSSDSSFSSSLMSTTHKDDSRGGAANTNHATKARATNIKTICDQTDYPDLCIATIAPFMKGNNNNVDPKQVLEVAMRASDQFARLGFAAAKRASESPATPPNTKKMLKTCLGSWDTVLYNYEKAIEALRIHDSGRMSTMLSAAITDVSDCDDAFQGVISPLIEYGEKMAKLTSICLAIVSFVT